MDRTAVLVAAPAPDPYASALALLEGATAYTGFVIAAQTAAGGTMVCVQKSSGTLTWMRWASAMMGAALDRSPTCS